MAQTRSMMMMAGLLCGLLLGGCSSNKTPNAKNFTRTLNAYFFNHDDCLYPSALRFPYEVSMTDTSSSGPKGLDALAKAGLLTMSEEKALKVKRYALTPAGSKATARFCYGHREVTSIDSFTPPATVDGRPGSTVSYHYKMMDVPIWAQTDQVQKAFPLMRQATTTGAEGKTAVALTLAGWQVPD